MRSGLNLGRRGTISLVEFATSRGRLPIRKTLNNIPAEPTSLVPHHFFSTDLGFEQSWSSIQVGISLSTFSQVARTG